MLDITTASTDPAAKYGLSSLEQLADRPAWMADALCREYPEVSFFIERGGDTSPARAICARCFVREECAEAGRREKFGIWGGTSNSERKVIRASGRRTAARRPGLLPDLLPDGLQRSRTQ